MATVKVLSSDNGEFQITMKVAQQSKVMIDMMELFGNDGDPPRLDVKAAILSKVIEWCEHHEDHPIPVGDDKDVEFTEWEKKFLEMDQNVLCPLCNAANYLDIKSLQNATCKALAVMISSKTTMGIREHFNIVNDLTEEEEVKLDNERRLCSIS